jgi:serine/threonine protein kinase
MFHILEMAKFKEIMTKFYGAEIILAVGYLHELKIIYRDIKVYLYNCSIAVHLGAISSRICYRA